MPFYRFVADHCESVAGDLAFRSEVKKEETIVMGCRSDLFFLPVTAILPVPDTVLEEIEISPGTLLIPKYIPVATNCSGYDDLRRFQGKVVRVSQVYDHIAVVMLDNSEFHFSVTRFHLAEAAKTVKTVQKCTCSTWDLMARGCNCGGV